MTVSTSASEITLGGNGSTTVFDFGFIGVSASDIVVSYTDQNGNQTLLQPTQYSVFLNPAASGQIWGIGGTITYPLSGPPIAAQTTLTIQRILPLLQQTSISNQGNFYPQSVEQALDTLCLEIQQVSARTGKFRGTWATDVAYNYGDIVVDGINGNNTTNWYMCIAANTSGVWSTDLASGDWTLILNLASISNPGTVAAGGDLTGNYPNPTIAKIQGVTVAGVEGTGDVVMSSTLSAFAPLASPVFTGDPEAPTAAPGNNTTQLATTAFVQAALPVNTLKTVKQQVFSSSGTYVPSAGMQYCTIEVVGGGGGGSSDTSNTFGGNGGGSGAYARQIFSAAAIGASQTVVVGSGGNGGAASGVNAGTSGGTTSVGTLISANGGSGAAASGGPTVGGVGGTAGSATFASQGAPGSVTAGAGGWGGSFPGAAGNGGSSFFAGGGLGGSTAGAAGGNGAHGSGGGGGSVNGYAGGNGGAGFVVITEYCSQ